MKVDVIGRIAVFDKVSEDAPSYRPTFKEQIGAERAEIAVFKTTASFELGDTLELQQDAYRHNGSLQHKRDFLAVSGTWSGYDIDKYNGKKVSEAFVYASESFDFKNLNEPWPQVENGNPDMYPDMVADRFRIGAPSEPIFGTGEDFFIWEDDRPDFRQLTSPSEVMNLHPHYNEQGQVDAIILDYSDSYAAAAGLYRYNVRQLDENDTYTVFDYGRGDLYELTPENLEFFGHSNDIAKYIIEDTETGFVDVWSRDVSSEEFVNSYLFNSEMYENKGTSYYLLPNKQKGAYSVYEFRNVDEVYKMADVTNDGKLTFVESPVGHNHAAKFAHNFDKAISLGQLETQNDKYFYDLDDESKQMVADAVAKQNLEFKPRSTERYTMTFMNAKGWPTDMILDSKKLKSPDDAVAHAEKLIETWRGGKEDSRVKLLKLSTIIKNQYDVSGYKAVKTDGEVIVDNMSLTLDDLSDLTVDEQSK